MSYSIAFLEEARAELDDAYNCYEEQRYGLGSEFMLAVQKELGSIAENPFLYPIAHKDIRRALVRRFPYAVQYVLDNDQIIVLSVFHSSRDPARWQSRG